MRTPVIILALASAFAGAPASLAHDTQDANAVLTAPLDVSTGRPVVDVMINGEGPFPFVLDTGAAGPVIRPELVETLGLTVTGRGEVRSPLSEDTMTVDQVGIDTLSVAGAVVTDFYAMVIGSVRGASPTYYGVIGPSLFREYGRTAFDFVDYEVEFGGVFDQADDGAWRPIGATTPIIETEMVIGEAAFPVHIDTGSPGILTAPRALETDLPLSGPVTVIGRGRTIDTEFEIHGAPLDAVAELGVATVPLENVRFFDAPFGNLGMGGLHGLALEFDWETERFALTGVAEPREMRRARRAPPRTEPEE